MIVKCKCETICFYSSQMFHFYVVYGVEFSRITSTALIECHPNGFRMIWLFFSGKMTWYKYKYETELHVEKEVFK